MVIPGTAGRPGDWSCRLLGSAVTPPVPVQCDDRDVQHGESLASAAVVWCPAAVPEAMPRAADARGRVVLGKTVGWNHRSWKAPLCSIVRTLALLMRFGGASWRANTGGHEATPGHSEPLSVQLDSTPGHAQRRPATARKCLLSSRPQVLILLGAQFICYFRY
jgi:hypothetical protein